MKKIIFIGECSFDIITDASGSPLGSMPGGRIANAAAILSADSLPVTLVSEAASDPVGDTVVGFLRQAGVDTAYIDRFTEGSTPLMLYFCQPDGTARTVRYEKYPRECFDVAWPRIDPDDIVVFGGFYSLDERMRHNQLQLLSHARDRKAIIIYLPGYSPVGAPRITHLMPAILENLELADIVITRTPDLTTIFGVKTPDVCYHDHIDFYCRSLINIDSECRSVSYYSGKEMTSVSAPESEITASLMWNAGLLAGIVKAVIDIPDASPATFDAPADELRRKVLAMAADTANAVSSAITDSWKRYH